MPSIGKMNRLRVSRSAAPGVYLEGGTLGEVLLPNRYVTDDCVPGSEVDVFLYYDSEDRVVATTDTPLAMVDQFALLQATAVSAHGAFLNWGLPKDLFVPFREQQQPMAEGESYMVFIYTDGYNGRPLASSRIDRFLNKIPFEGEPGMEVDVLVAKNTELGYKCVVNNTHSGILYHSDVFKPLTAGQRLKAYVGKVRDDGKLDLLLQKPGYEKVKDLRTQILDALRENKGFLSLGDKSPAEEIYSRFAVSKKTYKQALGALYKERLIVIDKEGVWLVT